MRRMPHSVCGAEPPHARGEDKTGWLMQVDLPEVVDEVRAASERYEKALVSNDVKTLDVAVQRLCCGSRAGDGHFVFYLRG
jgi:hypothetical protein